MGTSPGLHLRATPLGSRERQPARDRTRDTSFDCHSLRTYLSRPNFCTTCYLGDAVLSAPLGRMLPRFYRPDSRFTGQPQVLRQQRNPRIRGTVKFAMFALFAATGTLPGKIYGAQPTLGEDPDVVLQRIRSNVQENLSHLANYTCHEVIERLVRPPSVTGFIQHDHVEVEVAFVGKRELFARPGESNFAEESISKLVPVGTIGTGNFGSHTHSIFVGDAGSFKFAGISNKDGHKAYRFDFQVPQEKSQFLVKHNGEQGIVAYHGSFWADVDTYDLVRLEIRADHIPANIGVRFVDTKMRYSTMQFNDSEFLLPQHSELEASDRDGVYSLDGVTLKQCREFRGDSAVTYAPAPRGSPIDRQSPVQ